MEDKVRFLQETVEEIFSLTPEDEAIASSREVVARYLKNDLSISCSIKWAEFEYNGRFIRGGTSRVDSMSSHLVSSMQEDPAISEIVTHAKEYGLRPGQLITASVVQGYFWCVPFTPSNQKEISSSRLRTILLSEELFMEILDLFNQDAELSVSEKRVVYQIVTGSNPGEAAKIDGVSVETKRSQLKKACSKLYCAGQTELVRLMLGQMIHLLYLCDAETSHVQITEEFGSEFFDETTKLSVQRLPNGNLMRFWELGPATGRPLLVIHGCLFPFLLLNARHQLEKHNIRLIVPVRDGYLDDQASSSEYHDGQLVSQTLENLTQFIQLQWDEPIPVLGHATGGLYAMLIAARQPKLFSSMMVMSLNLLQLGINPDSFSSKFLVGIRKLAKDNGIFEVLTNQFQRTAFSNAQATKFVLRRLFNGCGDDLDVVNGFVGEGNAFNWYRKLHGHSVLGISNDFRLIARFKRDTLSKIKIPLAFLHGPNDAFTSTSEIEEFINISREAKLVVLADGGHLVSASHPELLWDEIQNNIDQGS